MAVAVAPDVGEQSDADRSALRHESDVTRELVQHAHLLHVSRARIVRAEHAHAVGPAQRDSALAADAGNLGLRAFPATPGFGEAAVVDDRPAPADLGGLPDAVEHAIGADTECDDVGGFRYLTQVRVLALAAHGRMAR